jgi:hypothetical protein
MKTILLVAFLVLLPAVIAMGGQSVDCVSTGLLSSNAVIVSRPARLMDCSVFTDGANQATVTFYDNASAPSGNILQQVIVPGASLSGGCLIPPTRAANGIYMSITGAGANAAACYDVNN